MTRHMYPPPAHTGGMHPGDDWQRYQQQGYPQQQGQWYPQPGDPVVPLTAQPDVRIKRPMGSAPFLRQPRVLVALAAVVVLMIGGGWALFTGHRGHTAVPPVTSSSAPAVAPMGTTGAQIWEMWSTQPAPCDDPIGKDDTPPSDPNHLLAPDEQHLTGKWVTVASVKPALLASHSTLSARDIGERLQFIGFAFNQTKLDIASILDQVNPKLVGIPVDSPEAQRLKDKAGRRIDVYLGQFNQALAGGTKSLETGQPIDPDVVALFPDSGTCG